MTDDLLSEAEIDEILSNLSDAEWARARSIARLCANGLTGWTGDALLGEAIAKLYEGDRNWRRGKPYWYVLAGAMRSIRWNTRKKEKNGPIDPFKTVDTGAGYSDDEDELPGVVKEDDSTPMAIVDGRSQLKYIESLVADDEDAGMLLMAWAEGLRGKEAADELGWDMNRCEAARKRLMRKLAPVIELRKES
jgi:hypothetical protein